MSVGGGDSVSEGDGLSCRSIADARRRLVGSKKIRVVCRLKNRTVVRSKKMKTKGQRELGASEKI